MWIKYLDKVFFHYKVQMYQAGGYQAGGSKKDLTHFAVSYLGSSEQSHYIK